MQKVKHLEYEHGNSADVVKSDAINEMKGERETHDQTEVVNEDSKAKLKEAYDLAEFAHISDVYDKERDADGRLEDLVS